MNNLPRFLLDTLPCGSTSPIWPVTRFSLKRNVAGFHFPEKLSKTSAKLLLELLLEAIKKTPQGKDFLSFESVNLSPQERAFLSERFLATKDWQHLRETSSFLLSPFSLLLLINGEDHLLFQKIILDNCLEKAWQEFVQLEEEIGKYIPYAFSSRFGYLTSDPLSCGTALSITIYLHTPALVHAKTLASIVENLLSSHPLSTQIEINEDPLSVDFLQIQNKNSIGMSEETLFQELKFFAKHLEEAEKKQRAEYRTTKPHSLQDSISKRFGLLKHAHELQLKEALEALSSLKMGLDLGWVKGISDLELNALFFTCRRAHLSQITPDISIDSLTQERALLLQEKLKNTVLSLS